MNTFESAASALRLDNWLISPEGLALLESVLSQAHAANMGADKNDDVLPSREVKNAMIIPVSGPMATCNNFISAALGWTTYQSLSEALDRYSSRADIGEIILYMDTPGGSAKGMSELGQNVKSCSVKVSAYVAGTCASAGYWIASQCSSIAAAPDAIIGSIGTRSQYEQPRSNVVTSQNAPNKILNQANTQALVNELEELFIEAVASGRGVSVEHVKQHYGQGGVMTGRKAKNVGMIDGVAFFNQFLSSSGYSEGNPETSIEDSWAAAAASSSADGLISYNVKRPVVKL